MRSQEAVHCIRERCLVIIRPLSERKKSVPLNLHTFVPSTPRCIREREKKRIIKPLYIRTSSHTSHIAPDSPSPHPRKPHTPTRREKKLIIGPPYIGTFPHLTYSSTLSFPTPSQNSHTYTRAPDHASHTCQNTPIPWHKPGRRSTGWGKRRLSLKALEVRAWEVFSGQTHAHTCAKKTLQFDLGLVDRC